MNNEAKNESNVLLPSKRKKKKKEARVGSLKLSPNSRTESRVEAPAGAQKGERGHQAEE